MDAQVLGQLLTLQSFLDVMSEEEEMLRFAVHGLRQLPGVHEAKVCVEGRRVVSDRNGDITVRERCDETRECDRTGCALSHGQEFHCPLLHQNKPIGHLSLLFDRPAEAEPYLSYYRNFAHFLSIVLSHRRNVKMLEKAYEEASKASAAKSDFLASMSHELRTPLNTIIGYSETLLVGALGALGNPKHQEYLGDIHRAGRHLLDVINDVLDLARIEAGKLELSEEQTNLADLVDEAVALVRPAAISGEIQLSSEVMPDLTVIGDARRLKQVIVNLLSNAIKFTLEGGRVTVSSEVGRNGGTRVIVADTGIGMSRDDIKIAKTMFGQIATPQARRHKGTGIGLSLVQGLVHAHGGRFELKSELGVGTQAAFSLPAHRSLMKARLRSQA